MKRASSLGVSACLLLFACNRETPPVAEQPRGSLTPPAVTPAKLEQPAPGAPAVEEVTPSQPSSLATNRVSDPTFELSLRPKGDYASGKPGEVELVLEAKEPYHVNNDGYPFKFTLKETKGLKFASTVLDKDQIKLEKSRASLSVPFTPELPGTHVISGRFAFSVCSEDKCLTDKRDLSLSFAAK